MKYIFPLLPDKGDFNLFHRFIPQLPGFSMPKNGGLRGRRRGQLRVEFYGSVTRSLQRGKMALSYVRGSATPKENADANQTADTYAENGNFEFHAHARTMNDNHLNTTCIRVQGSSVS